MRPANDNPKSIPDTIDAKIEDPAVATDAHRRVGGVCVVYDSNNMQAGAVHTCKRGGRAHARASVRDLPLFLDPPSFPLKSSPTSPRAQRL
ncbi:hypothetical protein EVAR_103497_1 [Eumeta japonica]|uniref:Uncharacterized protein n=1 Tax=Eumeta variegata TaxID=151549 RepID=A0A4C1ZHU0_EUMVA|nr:hypothetical protein EVAR_103497_1 [Eumeta japonica]